MKRLFVALFIGLFSTNVFAALGVTVSVSPSTAIINQMVTATLAISNTGTSTVSLSDVQITANYNGVPGGKIPAAFSKFAIPPGATNSIASGASNAISFPMQAVFFAPSTGVTGSGSGKYYIGAIVTSSDGSITSATTAGQITVNPVSLPLYERL